jgi:hypothetical protein
MKRITTKAATTITAAVIAGIVAVVPSKYAH